MMAKANKPVTGKNTLEITAGDGDDRDVLLAKVALAPGARHAATASNFAASMFSR